MRLGGAVDHRPLPHEKPTKSAQNRVVMMLAISSSSIEC